MWIKKLRFLGISIEAIKAYQQGEKSLAELLTGRLEEIDSDEGILEKQAQVCRQTIRSGVENIEDIQIDEAAEAWQKRLMALLRDDIVHHSLSRDDFNKDVLLTYLTGCGVAILINIIWMMFFETSVTGNRWFGFMPGYGYLNMGGNVGSKLICAGELSIQTQVEIALLALLLSVLHTGQWIGLNRKKEHFTR